MPTAEPSSPSDRALDEKQRADLPAGRAERAQDPDFRSPLRHRNRERVEDDEHADEQREQAGDVRRHRVDLRQSSRTAAPRALGGFHLEAGAEHRLQLLPGRPRRDAFAAPRDRCGRTCGRGRRPSAPRRRP